MFIYINNYIYINYSVKDNNFCCSFFHFSIVCRSNTWLHAGLHAMYNHPA